MIVIKRDGSQVPFEKQKIIDAISKAMGQVGYADLSLATAIASHISEEFCYDGTEKTDVETIQEMVEDILMDEAPQVAKEYIRYRYLHKMARDKYSDLMSAVEEKLTAKNVQNQNANVDEHSFGGRIGEAASLVNKKYALDYLVSPMAKKNHEENMIYIHDLDHYAVGSHNCYLRTTKFITSDGIKTFEDFSDGDVVTILAKDGKWRDATVHFYGRQPMYEIDLTRCGKTKTVVSTRNHRWFLSDGKVTDNIQIGDRLLPLTEMEPPSINTKREAEMFSLGFILGDGYDHNGELEVKFCTKDKEAYIPYFEQAGYHIGHSNGYPYARKTWEVTKQTFLNYRLWKILSFEDKRALFYGYLSADGSKTTNTKYLWTSDTRMCEMIEDISCLCGYHIFKKTEDHSSTNYYSKEDRILYQYVLTTRYSNNSTWVVTRIAKGEHRNKDYEAWCLEEPVTHSFTLDGGVVTGNCLSIPFDKLLANGFNTRQTDVRPAQSVSTAFQLVAVIFQIQSLQQFGGVSATHLDWTMVPYVRKSFYKHWRDGVKFIGQVTIPDDVDVDPGVDVKPIDKYPSDGMYFPLYRYAYCMTVKEVNQAVEGMYHNLNTLQSRSGNQLPFTSINYGTCTLPEGRMVIEALLNTSIKGIGKLHKTSIFPCGIFQCMKGVNRHPGDPNYDLFRLALKSTSQRLYPNYANVDWSGNEGYDPNDPKTYFSTMGCRTANGWDINGMGQTKDGRGNICPTTIIMPTIAMMAKEEWMQKSRVWNLLNDEEAKKKEEQDLFNDFIELLDQKIHEAKDMLIERFNWICEQSPESAKFMYENGTMEGYIPKEGIRSALKHGTLALGQLGMAETLQILFGCDHTSEKGMKYAKQIEQLFKDRCAEFKEQYKLNFGVYYTPAENLCYTAMQKFKDKYGVIKNVSDKEFFTNSIHVPVWKNMTPFEKIDIESQLTGYSSAGCITYVELDTTCKNNLDALESIVGYAMDHDIPYFAINVPNDTCMECGYCDTIGNACPICGGTDIKRLRRVTGYLTGDYKTAFNKGKQQEVDMRVKHGGGYS